MCSPENANVPLVLIAGMYSSDLANVSPTLPCDFANYLFSNELCIPMALIKSSVHITNLSTLERPVPADVDVDMLSSMIISK